MKNYVDREVLLQVKRIYSQDEVIADLHRQLREANFKIGVLESEVAELSHSRESLNQELLEALKRIKQTGVFVGAIAQEMMDAAIAKAEGEKT